MKRRTSLILFSLSLVLFTIACFKHPTGMRTGVPRGVNVSLPHAMHPEAAANVLKDSTVIVSVPMNEEFYIGSERYQREDLRSEIDRRLKDKPPDDRIVYLAGGVSVPHGAIVSVLDQIRLEDIDQVGLIVEQEPPRGAVPRVFKVKLLPPPDPNEYLKPHPLTLVATLKPDLTINLNQESMGSVTDPGVFESMLLRIFRQRTEMRAYRPGTETRTDLPESERVEKTLIIKANKSMMYGDIIRLIDVAIGAGANPILIQLDDLPD